MDQLTIQEAMIWYEALGVITEVDGDTMTVTSSDPADDFVYGSLGI